MITDIISFKVKSKFMYLKNKFSFSQSQVSYMKNSALFFSVILIFFILISGCISTDPGYQELDEHFKTLYKTTIHDAGKLEIATIVNTTSHLGKDPQRLTLIADIITSNFTDPFWPYQQNEIFFCYYPDDELHYNHCRMLGQTNIKSIGGSDDPKNTFLMDKQGRVRQISFHNGMIALNRDPFWIAYQKTGACKELSIFFNETANESGFSTRIVQSDGNSHVWNEVLINGVWMFFDVQRYGMRDSNNSSKWFGNTSDYAEAHPWPLCDMINNGKNPGIFLFDINTGGYGENRNYAYDPNNICKNQSTS